MNKNISRTDWLTAREQIIKIFFFNTRYFDVLFYFVLSVESKVAAGSKFWEDITTYFSAARDFLLLLFWKSFFRNWMSQGAFFHTECVRFVFCLFVFRKYKFPRHEPRGKFCGKIFASLRISEKKMSCIFTLFSQLWNTPRNMWNKLWGWLNS